MDVPDDISGEWKGRDPAMATWSLEARAGLRLRRAWGLHGVQHVDALYLPNAHSRAGGVTDVWACTDIGLLVTTLKEEHTHEVLMPSAASTLTAWRDVRDIEADSDVAAVSGGDDPDNLHHFVQMLRVSVQVPRIDWTARSVWQLEDLSRFVGAAIRRYNAAR